MLIGLVVALPLRARADADEINPPPPDEVRAPFTLFVNHAKKGEMNVLLKDGDVYVKRSDLVEAGVTVPPAQEVDIDGERLLSLNSMTPPLSYELDETEITLKIIAPIRLLPTAELDFGGRPPNVVYQRNVSAFFNYAPRVNEEGRMDMYDEMGLSFDGDLLYSSAYLSSAHRPVRGLSNFIIDDRDKLQRITFGDSLAMTGPLGSGRFVGGATVARRFELDPYMRKTPSLGYVGTTMTPATLDVYVNGSRVRSEELQPGTFRLDNLHVGGGRGIAQYVVRDVFGHEETYNAPFYASEGVLRAGLQDYSYSAGVLRSNLTTRSWDYGEGAVLGRHRIGLSDHLTLGARAEASRPVISGGPSLALALPIGQIDLELAMSRDTTSGTGMASYLAYGYASRVFGAGFFGRAMSSHYSTIDQRGYRDRALVEAGVFQSMPIGSYLSFGTQGSLSKYRDRGTSLRGSVQWALRIGSRANLFASASKARNEDGTAPWDVLLTLNYSLADRLNAAATGHVANGEPSLLLDANRSLPVGQGYGFRGSGVIAEHGNSSADALLQYQTLFGRYSGEYSYDHQRHRGSVEAAGGIAIVPGIGIFPTLPVQDGFAVIRVAGVKNVRGYVNNQELGRTDRNGNLLVPNLLSYYGNRLGIASEDVPIQYNMESTDLTLAPPLRGVAIADFSVSIPHYYRGHTIVDEHGTRVVPKYGDIRVMGPKHQELVSPLGEDGEFELENVPLGAQSFTIDYTGGECTFTLDIADSDQTVIDLGELVCHMP